MNVLSISFDDVSDGTWAFHGSFCGFFSTDTHRMTVNRILYFVKEEPHRFRPSQFIQGFGLTMNGPKVFFDITIGGKNSGNIGLE